MTGQPDLEDLKIGALFIILDGERTSPLPLERTEVSGSIISRIASVQVTQHFGNPFNHPIELEYLFPLPHEAAIVDYGLTIGSRQIRAEIKEVEAARKAYHEAVSSGKRASLLEQRRPNLFSIQVGNVQPGEKIICTLQYEDRLDYLDGSYEFVFPMGITPRYHSPAGSMAEAQAVDAPTALPGEKTSPVTIDLTLDAGTDIADPTSPSHAIQITRENAQRLSLTIPEETIPNKDFVLRYDVATRQAQPILWASTQDDSEIVLMTLVPPQLDFSAEPEQREFIFVLDRSGSMSDGPMNQAKNALKACLRTLNAGDTFYIQAFDDRIDWLAMEAAAVTQAQVDAADNWLGNVHSRGGTEILPAIEAALSLPVDVERRRYVVFLTDGAVSADEKAIRKIAQQRGQARVFTFGIGPAVNRFLLDKVAQMGRGTAQFVGTNDDIETAITRFQDRISYPAIQDIELEWQNAEAWDIYPETLPDLYIGQPLEIVARMKRKGAAALRLTGQLRGNAIEMVITVPPAEAEAMNLQRLWARARIEHLLDQQYQRGDQESIRQQVISLGLDNRLMTPFTAFVAVDSEVTTGGDAKQVQVSVPLPEGLKFENFYGQSGASGYVSAGLMPMSPSPAPQQYMAAMPMDMLSDVDAAMDVDPMMAPPPPRHAVAPKQQSAGGQTLTGRVFSTLLGRRDEDTNEVEAVPDLASREERLKWLARTQNVNGSWDDDTELTAAAVLAFVRAGHTIRTGNYRQQVRKAALWLKDQVQAAQGFALFVAVRALNELNQLTGDRFVSDDVAQNLPKPATDLERAASGETRLQVPFRGANLDDLRLKALLQGDVSVPDKLKQGTQAKLVQVWLAVGKPV